MGKYSEIDLLTKDNEELKQAKTKLEARNAAYRLNIMMQQKSIARLTEENANLNEECIEFTKALFEAACVLYKYERENNELKRRIEDGQLLL